MDQSSKNQTPNHELLLTRRRFLYGALGVGALALSAGNTGCTDSAYAENTEELNYLSVPEDAVITLDDFAEIESSQMISLVGNFQLPYGTLLWTNGDTIAACLLPTESSKPLTKVGILFLNSGHYITVLEAAIGQEEDFDIYDVRANDQGLIWTEANILSGTWRIYSATFNGESLGEALLLDESDAGWETPTIAAVSDSAFWQVLPVASGPHSSEHSLLKRARFGSASSETIYSSLGRMSTPPYPLADNLVITPRTDTDTVHHQLTLLDAASGDTKDAVVLPNSMKPLEAGYGNTGFTFSFEGSYSIGGGIAPMGTYTPVEAHSTYDYADKTWFRYNRDPSAAPAWCKNLFLVKSTSSIRGIDLANRTFFVLAVENGADSWGDYLASTGVNNTFVTFAHIHTTSIEGEENKYCLVRVWAPLS